MKGNDFYSDIKWFYANYKSLSKKFENKFIVINKQKVVINANNIKELKEKAKEQKIDLRKSVVKFVAVSRKKPNLIGIINKKVRR